MCGMQMDMTSCHHMAYVFMDALMGEYYGIIFFADYRYALPHPL